MSFAVFGVYVEVKSIFRVSDVCGGTVDCQIRKFDALAVGPRFPTTTMNCMDEFRGF